MAVRLAEVRTDPIDPQQILGLVTSPEAGASLLFCGTVRNHDPQMPGEVVGLDYTCHPSAQETIEAIVARAARQYDPAGEAEIAAVHRVGHLDVGEHAFVVAVSSPHRRLAFDVLDQVVERVKAELPVWKQQFAPDGDYRWSGL